MLSFLRSIRSRKIELAVSIPPAPRPIIVCVPECSDVNETGVIITGNEITAVKIGDDILPFLDDIPILEKFPYVTVDMGAVKFVCKGANIMRPGITKFSDFESGEIVCVIEESQNKFLAVGKAEISSKEAEDASNGEVIKNMHYISDDFWESKKEIKD